MSAKKKIETKSEEAEEKKLAKIELAKEEKLAETLKIKEVEIKPKVEEKETLVPIEDYLKSSMHLGTRAITPDMKPFVYKRRADSLAVFNTTLLDEKIREGAEFLAKY